MKRRKLCPHCGRAVSPNASFCPYCGFDLSKTICDECLKKVDLSLEVCPYCGNSLRKTVVVPVRMESISDERYEIVEVKDNYTILKEKDITLERYKPVTLEDFFYTSIGIFYDVIYLDDEKKVPVLLPSWPVMSLSDYWEVLRDDERVGVIFSIVNLFLKHYKLYISPSNVLFDADGRLISLVSEDEEEGYLNTVAWLKWFIKSLKVDDNSLLKSIVSSSDFDKIDSVNELINLVYTTFSSFSKVDIESFAITSPGIVRGHNEDNYVTVEYSKHGFNGSAPYTFKTALFLVSDGMGGHRGGEEASRLIVKIVSEEILSYLLREHAFLDIARIINRAISRANAVVFEKNRGASTEREKMGATLAGALLIEDELWYFNIGDSPIMLYDGRSLLKVSVDDVMLTNKKSLTQALGVISSDKLLPHISKYKVENEVKFLLCSDGLTDQVKFAEIEDALREYPPDVAAKLLHSLALERGGIDNITIIIAKVRRNRLF